MVSKGNDYKWLIGSAGASLTIVLPDERTSFDSDHPIRATIKINADSQFAAYGIQVSLIRRENVFYRAHHKTEAVYGNFDNLWELTKMAHTFPNNMCQ